MLLIIFLSNILRYSERLYSEYSVINHSWTFYFNQSSTYTVVCHRTVLRSQYRKVPLEGLIVKGKSWEGEIINKRISVIPNWCHCVLISKKKVWKTGVFSQLSGFHQLKGNLKLMLVGVIGRGGVERGSWVWWRKGEEWGRHGSFPLICMLEDCMDWKIRWYAV